MDADLRTRYCATLLVVLTLGIAISATAGGLSFVELVPRGDHQGLANPEALVVSPDGLNVYTASDTEDMIGVLLRNAGTPALLFLEAHEDDVGGVDGLNGPSDVTVSLDGACVYATGRQDDGVAVFSRGVLGALTYLEKKTVERPEAVVVSSDGLHVYVLGVSGGNAGGVHVFSRTPPGCVLTPVEVETGDAAGLGKGPEAMAMSFDGAHLYVGGSISGGSQVVWTVNVFARNPVTGMLTFVERESEGANGLVKLGRVSDLAVSLDGGSVYATSPTEDSVVGFSRNAGTGELTFVQFQKDSNLIRGLDDAMAVVVSPDGAYVYVAGPGDDAIAVFNRDTATGVLRFLEAQRDPYIDPPNNVLASAVALAVPFAGDNLYAGGKAITVFATDRCGNGTVGVDEQCDDGNLAASDGCSPTCRLELCGPTPSAGCRGTQPLGARLLLKDNVTDARDQLKFDWTRGDATTLLELGTPTVATSYLVCLYDGSANAQPLLAVAAPAAGACKNGVPCWASTSTGFKYKDKLNTPDGLQTVQLKASLVNGGATMQFQGKGLNLSLPSLPLTFPVTVQVKNTANGVCWDAVFASADVNDAGKLKARGN